VHDKEKRSNIRKCEDIQALWNSMMFWCQNSLHLKVVVMMVGNFLLFQQWWAKFYEFSNDGWALKNWKVFWQWWVRWFKFNIFFLLTFMVITHHCSYACKSSICKDSPIWDIIYYYVYCFVIMLMIVHHVGMPCGCKLDNMSDTRLLFDYFCDCFGEIF
jgi:hypothetical protein